MGTESPVGPCLAPLRLLSPVLSPGLHLSLRTDKLCPSNAASRILSGSPQPSPAGQWAPVTWASPQVSSFLRGGRVVPKVQGCPWCPLLLVRAVRALSSSRATHALGKTDASMVCKVNLSFLWETRQLFGKIKLEYSVLSISSLQRVRDDEDVSLSGGFSVVPKIAFHFWRWVRVDRGHLQWSWMEDRRQRRRNWWIEW